MKKKQFCGMMMLSAVLLLAGCTADVLPESVAVPGTDDQVPVNFSVSDQLSLTRAATNIVTFDANEQLKVYVKPAGADGYTAYTYTTAAAGQSNVSLTAPTPPPYFPAGAGTTVEAYAYYPASAVVGETFSVAANQTADASYKASDLMFAANRTITKGSAAGTNLAMSHLMAQLHLNITGQGVTVSRVLINAKRSVTFGVSAAGVPSTSLTGSASDITAATAAGSAYVCIPQQPINTVTVKVIAAGAGAEADRTATFSFTSTSDFVAGSSYPVNLTVSAAQLGAVTAITDWNGMESVTVTPTGDLTIEPISDVTYNGSAWTPSLTVKKDGTTLTQNATNGYTCQWFNNTNAGTAFVIVRGQGTYDGSEAVAKFTINKANAAVTAAPTIRSTYYTGGSLQIINAGSCTGGTMRYKLGSGSWTTDATEIVVTSTGNYTVYWKVDGDANHNSVAETSFVVAVTYPPMSSATSSHVGKVICTSGHIHSTVSEATAAGCTASGIIAYVGSAGTADKSTNSGSYKGLALALYDYGGSLTSDGTTCKWYTADGGTCITNGRSNTVATAIGTTGDFGKGIDNTNRLATAACGSGHTHAAAQNAKNFSVARPTGASQWFLPTMYQWNLMVKAMCGKSTDLTTSTNNDYKADKFNEKITAAGGRGVLSSYYWSSVEYSADYAWDMYFYYGYANGYGKSFNNRVRAVFAF